MALQHQLEEQRRRGREAARRLVAAKDKERRKLKAALLAVDTDVRGEDQAAGTAAGDGDSAGNGGTQHAPGAPAGRGSVTAIMAPDPACLPRDGAASSGLRPRVSSAKGGAGGGDSASAGTLGAATFEAIAAMARDPPLVMSDEALGVLEGGVSGAQAEGGAGAAGYGPELARVVEALKSLGR